MTESARSAVDADDDVAFAKLEGCGDGRIEDLHDLLHFEIVIARSERAHLVALAVLRVLGHFVGLRARHAAVLFDPFEIGGGAVAAIDRPPSAAREHGVHLGRVEVQASHAADARRHAPRQVVGDALLERLDVLPRQPGVRADARRTRCRSRRRRPTRRRRDRRRRPRRRRWETRSPSARPASRTRPARFRAASRRSSTCSYTFASMSRHERFSSRR